jgi:Flp pilus assembly protein TadG
MFWLNLGRNTRGSEIAEFAMILPLFFMILIGIFYFGQAFRIYGTITHAAREGARAAVAPACATCTGANDPSQNAYNAIQSALLAAKLDPNQLQQPIPLPPVCSCSLGSGTNCSGGSNPAPVACDIGQSKICVQGVTRLSANDPANETNVELSSPGTNGAGECGVSVSFQYPYKFWLPFSSLSNQTLNLRAQAQMRAETQ